MRTAWRPALAALRTLKRMPAKFLPVAGIVRGIIAGAVYWATALFWPSSVAVVLALLAGAVIGGDAREESITRFHPSWLDVFVLLIKYNALMALTSANLPFPVPENMGLAVIMICGQAASHGLLASVTAARADDSPRMTGSDLAVALAVGFAPALVLGIPGLAGLVAAIVLRLGLTAFAGGRPRAPSGTLVNAVQPLSEACFYLGALATWKYT